MVISPPVYIEWSTKKHVSPDRCRQPKDHTQKEYHEDEGDHTYMCSSAYSTVYDCPPAYHLYLTEIATIVFVYFCVFLCVYLDCMCVLMCVCVCPLSVPACVRACVRAC